MMQPVQLRQDQEVAHTPPKSALEITLRWMLATVVAGTLASFIVGALFPFTWGTVIVLAGTIWGVSIGVGQMRFLQRYSPGCDWSKWAVFSATGATIGSLIFIALYAIPALLISYEDRSSYRMLLIPYLALLLLIGGLILGVSQWLLMRKYMQKAGWWVLACTLGCSVGGLIGGIIATIIYETLIPRNWKAGMLLGSAEGFWTFLAGTIGTSVLGLVTGLAFTWLLRHSSRSGPL